MQNKIQDKLQEIANAYSKKLPNKLREIDSLWLKLKDNYHPKLFEDFHREIHSLCGSAGTYGYAELSKAARELEIYLKSLLGSNALTNDQQTMITRLMSQLQTTSLKVIDNAIASETKTPLSKLIYILDSDKNFVTELSMELHDADYELHLLDHFSELMDRLEKFNTPAAVIIEAEFLGETEVQLLLELQNQRDIVVPLFCIAKEADLLTRLRGVRAGSIGFLQKPLDPYDLIKTLDRVCGLSTAEPFRILIVDDSQSLAEYYRLILQGAGMVARSISNPLEAMDVMLEFQPDLLLLDIYMPECSGIELAAVLRQELRYTHIPIIFLSSEDDKFKQLSALSSGGDDFLTKPILPQHLVAAVKSRAERAGILSSYMVRDSLTGLLNHSNILHQLDVELARAQRYKVSVSFVMIDIDHFKTINDRYGHMMGDRVLKKLSELLTTRLRKSDYVGRYGGEEFAIILPDTNIELSKKIIEDMREKFSKIHFTIDDVEFSVSFSAGIANFPDMPMSTQLIEAADQALYKAKLNGRNQVELFKN